MIDDGFWNMEMEENEHQSTERSSIGNFKGKDVEQFLEPESNCCIYRLPESLCKLNKAAYTPRLISIGPLHYGNKKLMRMESQKERYWTRFEERVSPEVLKEFKTYILKEEKSIRAHYSVTSILPTSKYVEIILQDVIFIMELFLRKHDYTNDFLLKSPMVSYIILDLLVVENQLPYSLLDHLYSKAFPSTRVDSSFFALLRHFFGRYSFFKDVSLSESQTQFKHFTDFLRCALVMTAKLELKLGYKCIDDILCATKLKRSGLKFKGAKDKSLLDIRFAKTKKYGKWLQWIEASELQIPTLEVDDNTEILLRNLMAWEMFHYPMEKHICNYAALMDYLINSEEDVDLLVEKGIIVNKVGENEAIAKMFNRLCSHIVSSESCYYGISQEMIKHYKYPWNHAKATLKSVYFNNPWTGTATVAAAFLLILTLVQTICSIIQVHQGYAK